MKNSKIPISFLLALIILLSAFAAVPFTANAEETIEYPLWVNSEQITSEHLTVQCGDGSATFVPATNTLTLEDAEITKGVPRDWLYTGILSYLDEGLTIVVKGNCSITETGGDGIGSYNSDLIPVGDGNTFVATPYDITVCGDGKLTITESTRMYGYGLYCTGALTLDGVDITIRSAATGIWANSLTVKNSDLDIVCSTLFSGFVVNNGDFLYENSTATAESAGGVGVLLGSDRFPSHLIMNSGKLDLKGTVGVSADTDDSTVTVNGGKLSIEAAGAAFNEKYTADADAHIFLGEGVSVTSGGYTQTTCVIEGAASEGFTLCGSVTSFLSDTDDITVTLYYPDSQEKVTVNGNSATYSFDNVPAGEYSLGVAKKNHVTRWYEVEVENDTTFDVKIHPIGDINGDGQVTNIDAARVNSHARGKSLLTGYEYQCGNVNNDGSITNIDYARVNSHARGKSSLWS